MPSERIYQRPAPRERNARGEGGRLRGELIEAASSLVAEHGSIEAATIRAVARRAGVAAPSVYLHFADRTALVEAVVERRFRDLIAAIEAAAAGVPAGAPAEYLRAGCRGYVEYGLANPGHYRVLFDTGREPPAGEAQQAAREAFGTLVEAIAACQAAGLARPGDAFDRAASVWCGMHGLVMLRTARADFPWPPLEPMLEELLVSVVGIPPRATPAEPPLERP